MQTKGPLLSTATAGAFCIGCMHFCRKKPRHWRRMFGTAKDFAALLNIAHGKRCPPPPAAAALVPSGPSSHVRLTA